MGRLAGLAEKPVKEAESSGRLTGLATSIPNTPQEEAGGRLAKLATTSKSQRINEAMEHIIFADIQKERQSDIVIRGQMAGLLAESFADPEQQLDQTTNALLLSELFGISFDDAAMMRPEMMRSLYGDETASMAQRFKETPFEGGFFGKIAESYRRGDSAVSSDIAVYEAAFEGRGSVDTVLDARRKVQEDIVLNPIEGNLVSNLFYKSANIVPGMVKGYWSAIPVAAEGMVFGVIAALAAGQSGPQVLAPEEIVTVPAGAIIGIKAGLIVGSAMFWYKQGAGSMYATMLEKEYDPEISREIAGIAAIPYALLEFLQVQQLTPGLRTAIQKSTSRTMVQVMGRVAKKYAGTLTTEILEEIGQEFIQIAAEDVSGILSKADIKMDKEYLAERMARLWATAKESAQAMALLPLPGTAIDINTGIRTGLSQKQQTEIRQKLNIVQNIPPEKAEAPADTQAGVTQAQAGEVTEAGELAPAEAEGVIEDVEGVEEAVEDKAKTIERVEKKEIFEMTKAEFNEFRFNEFDEIEKVLTDEFFEEHPDASFDKRGDVSNLPEKEGKLVAEIIRQADEFKPKEQALKQKIKTLIKETGGSDLTADQVIANKFNDVDRTALHEALIRDAVRLGKDVPLEVLNEFKGKEFADKAIEALPPPKPEGEVEVTKKITEDKLETGQRLLTMGERPVIDSKDNVIALRLKDGTVVASKDWGIHFMGIDAIENGDFPNIDSLDIAEKGFVAHGLWLKQGNINTDIDITTEAEKLENDEELLRRRSAQPTPTKPEREVAAAEKLEAKPADEIAMQTLRDKIGRAKTDKSRKELQRRLDLLEGGKPVTRRPKAELPPERPTKQEQAVIDAKEFNRQIREHQQQLEAGGIPIETETVDPLDAPLGRTMTPEWYEKNAEIYKETILDKGITIAKETVKGIDRLFGATSTRLRNISQELFRRTRRHVFNVMTRTTEQQKRVEPFIKLTKKLDKKTLNALDLAFKNSDGAKISEIAAQNDMSKELGEVRRVLNELFNQGNAVGLEIDYRKNYMPRVVAKPKKFLEFFQGRDDWSIVRDAIESKEQARGRVLTETERASVVNTLLRGYQTSALTLTAPGAAKARTVDEITSEINQFYADFRTSLNGYIQTMNEKISAREFFGRESIEIKRLRTQESTLRTRLAKLGTRQGRQPKSDADKDIRIGFFTGTLTEHLKRAAEQLTEVQAKLERMGADDLNNTIGQHVIDLVTTEQIKPSQEKEIRDLLVGLFDPKGSSKLFGDVKALMYIDVLGSPLNAITQLEELGLSFYRAPLGFIPALVRSTLNLSEITLADIGVTSIGIEFQEADARRALGALLSVTGFEKIDRIGKQTFIDTVITKMRSQAKRPTKSFMDRLQRVFGDQTEQVIIDLKSGQITDNIKYLAFNQLLDIQPLALTEMPEAYNRAGNLRIFYSLKTFITKQIDFVRTEALQDMKSPDTFMRGFGRLVWMAFSLALFGAGADALKDFLRGRPFDLWDSVIDTFLRRIFFSKFQADQALSKGPGRIFMEGFLPPTKLTDNLVKDMKKFGEEPVKDFQFWRSIPIVGELYYWWFGRGKEKAEQEQKREKTDKQPLF